MCVYECVYVCDTCLCKKFFLSVSVTFFLVHKELIAPSLPLSPMPILWALDKQLNGSEVSFLIYEMERILRAPQAVQWSR